MFTSFNIFIVKHWTSSQVENETCVFYVYYISLKLLPFVLQSS
jgi:hypothetical protein